MKKNIAVAALLLAAGAAFAQSQPGQSKNVYAELGYHNAELKGNTAPGYSPKLDTLSGIVGYKFHDNFSAELLLGTGISAKNTNIGGINLSTKLEHTFAILVRPSMNFTDNLEGFVRLGYGQSKLKVSSGGMSISDSDSSLIWGVGANYYFTKDVYGQLSYTSFYDKSGVSINGFGASVGIKF